MTATNFKCPDLLCDSNYSLNQISAKRYVAEKLLPNLFGPSRHYVNLETIQRTIEEESIHYKPTTIKRYLQEWQNEERIHDAGRGWYTDISKSWALEPQMEPIGTVLETLRSNFPLLDFTIWSTRELAPFFQHLPTRHATFLMIDRDAFEPVAEALRDDGQIVAVHPLGATAKAFVLGQADTVILRPRLSSDHIAPRARIEQALVDLYYEIQKLGLFDGEEFSHVARNLSSAYRLNITALKRYAERRKLDSAVLMADII